MLFCIDQISIAHISAQLDYFGCYLVRIEYTKIFEYQIPYATKTRFPMIWND